MLEFFNGLWEHIQFFRLEIAGGVFLLVAETIRRKYTNNTRILKYLDFLQATALKAYLSQNDRPIADTASKKRKLRRKIKRQIAKEARKVNRHTSKGQKRGR